MICFDLKQILRFKKSFKLNANRYRATEYQQKNQLIQNQNGYLINKKEKLF